MTGVAIALAAPKNRATAVRIERIFAFFIDKWGRETFDLRNCLLSLRINVSN
jgi:hypothetical protein